MKDTPDLKQFDHRKGAKKHRNGRSKYEKGRRHYSMNSFIKSGKKTNRTQYHDNETLTNTMADFWPIRGKIDGK